MISPKQKKILAFPYSSYDALICDGAVRSGKTSIMTVAFVDWAMRCFNGCRFGICGKTVDSATKNIVEPYLPMSYAKERYSLKWRRSDKELEVSNGKHKNVFEVFGGKDESSFTLIQGRTLGGVLMDEVVLMPQSFVNQALARCSLEGARLWFSCNPDSPSHWFYEEWIQNREKHNALYLHFAMTDNPSLSQKTLDRYKSMYSGVFYNRYIEGLWVRAEGLIYQQFADDQTRYETAKENLPGFRYLTVGVDFGGNKSAYAFVATGITHDWSPIALRSIRIPAKGVSVEQMISRFVTFCEGVEDDYRPIDYVYADCAEQAIINSMDAQTRWRILGSIKGEIIDRIRAMDQLLSSDRFKYVRGECDSLKKALCDAVWDDKKLEDVRLDDGTSDIDTLDAWEYSWSSFIRQIVRR